MRASQITAIRTKPPSCRIGLIPALFVLRQLLRLLRAKVSRSARRPYDYWPLRLLRLFLSRRVLRLLRPHNNRQLRAVSPALTVTRTREPPSAYRLSSVSHRARRCFLWLHVPHHLGPLLSLHHRGSLRLLRRDQPQESNPPRRPHHRRRRPLLWLHLADRAERSRRCHQDPELRRVWMHGARQGHTAQHANHHRQLLILLLSRVRRTHWHCPRSASAPPQGAPGGTGRLGTPGWQKPAH